MQDLETKSLWSQISGECIQGDLEGSKLTQYPFSHTTFGAFKEKYPNGRLLKKPLKGPQGSPYDSYYEDNSKLGVFGRADNFTKLDGKDKVYGIRFGDKEVAISRKFLEKKGFALVVHDSTRVYVNYEKLTKTVWANQLPDSVEPYSEGLFIRGSDTLTTEDVMGAAVPIISAYWFAWVTFFPETELIK